MCKDVFLIDYFGAYATDYKKQISISKLQFIIDTKVNVKTTILVKNISAYLSSGFS